MSKETNGAVPRLRFKEFDGEWEERMLGTLLLKHPEYGINAPAATYSNRLPTYLRITDISENGQFISNQKVSVAREVVEHNYLNEGEIVLARTGASVGKAYKYRTEDGRLVFAGFLIRVTPDSEQLDSEYLFQFLFTNQYWQWIAITSMRSGQPGINGNEYSSMPLPIPPSIQEQQKIAATLSSLDEVISAEAGRLDALKAHKRGLMQALFPAEGETVPRLRFKEFDGEWEEMKLGEVGEIITGNTPVTSDAENYGGEKLFVSPADINSQRYITQTKTTLSEKGYSTTRHVKANSILFVCIGSTIGKIAQNKFDCATNQQINAVVPYDNYYADFIYSVLESKSLVIAQFAGIQAVPIINKSLFASVKILLPSIPEQQKIASTLSSLDELITAQSQKIDALKLHKKGLMQGLFPSAKTRINY